MEFKNWNKLFTMKHYFVKLFVLTFLSSVASAQLPVNLVPNPSFENGVHPTNKRCFPFMIGLSDWKAVCFRNSAGECGNSPEWRDLNSETIANPTCAICFGGFVYGNNPFLDTKCISVGKDIHYPDGEHLYVTLYNGLEIGRKYKIRLLGMSSLGYPSSSLAVHLTESDDKWYQNPNSMKNAMYATHFTQGVCSAKAFEHIIQVNKSNLKQIVLQANHNFFYVDRVELYEYCTELLTRQGRYYKFDRELEEAETIIAGSVINNTPAMGDVAMLDGSITTYKASKEVKLTEGFYVNRGADFTAKIAPCGQDCPTTNIDYSALKPFHSLINHYLQHLPNLSLPNF
jgi:hypothetical protein